MGSVPRIGDEFPPDSADSAVDVLNSALHERPAYQVRKLQKLKQHEAVLPEASEVSKLAEQPTTEEREVQVEVHQALTSEPLIEHSSNRSRLRLLILTRDLSILKTQDIAQRRLLELAGRFDEVHVILLSGRGEGSRITVRLGHNIWIYPTYSRYWWQCGIDAYRIAREQLAFAQGFRADIIIAEDPFESGVVACLVAEKYGRPVQIHVLEDIYDPGFTLLDEHNGLRLFLAMYTFWNADSVRTISGSLQEKIMKRYPSLAQVTEPIPLYYNLSAWRDFIPVFDLHVRYPQFKFIMLHFSRMTALSHTDKVIAGVAEALKQYPLIGLVVVGTGPFRQVYEKQVIALGLQNQILFEPMPHALTSHMKTADVLIHVSEDRDEEDLILQAAATKLPLIAGARSIAGELFLDGDSAYICTETDTGCLKSKVMLCLHDSGRLEHMSLMAQQTVFERIEQDFGVYVEAFQKSIERGLVSVS